VADAEFFTVTVEIPIEDIVANLEEAGFAGSDENIATIAEALGDKWMTDLTEVNEYEFIIECMEDDLEPDINDEKAHRDWRMRQGAPSTD
jgi:hypothetical protein